MNKCYYPQTLFLGEPIHKRDVQILKNIKWKALVSSAERCSGDSTRKKVLVLICIMHDNAGAALYIPATWNTALF